MGQIENAIGEELRRIVDANRLDKPVMTGKVKTVDEGAGTCSVCLTVDGPDTQRDGISLNTVTSNDNGLLLIPAAGSQIWIAELDGPGKWGVVKCSNVDKVIARVGAARTTLLMTNEEVNMQIGGSDAIVSLKADELSVRMGSDAVVSVKGDEVKVGMGGAAVELSVKSGEIVMNGGSNGGVPISANVAERIRRVEDMVNDILSKFTTWLPIPNDGGAALYALFNSPPVLPITPSTTSDYLENTDVKH
jgi:hypothetical protein